MRKRLYLHIGMGKTGTTALQDFFWSNRKLLLNYDICYPDVGVQSGAHHLLSPHVPPFLKDSWKFIDVKTWAPKITKCAQSKILLSSELMAWTSADIATDFCEVLKEYFEPKVVIYLRRQDNLIMAGYNQQIKAGTQIRDIYAVLENQFSRFDYEKKLEPWVCSLGESNIIVRPYERQQFFHGDLRKDFMHHVFGLEVSEQFQIDDQNRNPRLSLLTMEYKRFINNLMDSSLSMKFNDILLRHSAAVDSVSTVAFSDQAILSPLARLDILRRSAGTNDMIARKYLGRSDGRIFYDAEPDVDKIFTAIELSEEDINKISQYIQENEPNLMKVLKDAVSKGLLSEMPRIVNAAKKLKDSLA